MKSIKSDKVAVLCVKRMKLADLKPHSRNEAIRRHPDPGTPRWNALHKSLEHDYYDPLIFNKRNGMLVSGHLRLKILLADKYTHADVSIVDYDEPTHLARMISANRDIGEDIMSGVSDLLLEIDTGNLDISLTGFDEKAIEDLMTAVPPLNEKEIAGEEKYITCPKCGHKIRAEK